MAPTTWTLADLEALGSDELDFQEFKGSAWLSDGGEPSTDLRVALSKQLSAFANGAGGHLFIGLDDHGRIDGGVPVDLKRGGTRSWLEDIVPALVDPPLATFNVHEVPADDSGRGPLPGRAVYVLHIPSSDLAPHQAIDHRYYLRIAGKSRPMGHVHVQDVLRRSHHPQVHLHRIVPFGPIERLTSDARGPKVQICFRAFVENRGRTLARHVGVEVSLPRAVVNREVRRRTLASGELTLQQVPGTVNFFRYHPQPVFPGQDLYFLTFWLAVHDGNVDAVRSGVASIQWRVYADDAPAREGSRPVNDYAVVREALTWLDNESRPPKRPPTI
jgi:hypothetical protein